MHTVWGNVKFWKGWFAKQVILAPLDGKLVFFKEGRRKPFEMGTIHPFLAISHHSIMVSIRVSQSAVWIAFFGEKHFQIMDNSKISTNKSFF